MVSSLVFLLSAAAAAAAAAADVSGFLFECKTVVLDVEGGAAQLRLDRSDAASFPWSISILAANSDQGHLTPTDRRVVFQTLANGGDDGFLALAFGDFGGASHNGNFNITGWEPAEATSIQTVSSCGHNASALWMSGALLASQDAAAFSATYNFTVRASNGAAHWTVSLNDASRGMDAVTNWTAGGIGNVSRSLLRIAVHDGSTGCYGAGEQYTDVDLRGSFIPIITTEQGVGRDARMFVGTLQSVSYPPEQQLVWLTEFLNGFGSGAGGSRKTTYTSIPTFVCPENAVAVSLPDSSRVASFDFRTQRKLVTDSYQAFTSSRVEIQVLLMEPWSAWVFWNSSAVGGLQLDDDSAQQSSTPVLQVLDSLTSLLGRLPAPPLWVDTGAIVALEGGTEAVMSNLRSLLEWGVPVAGVWIQDWSGKRVDPFGSRLWWNWELDEELYVFWSCALRTFVPGPNLQFGFWALT